MPTREERIASLKNKIAKKRERIEELNKTLQNTQNNIRKAKAELEVYEEKIQSIEAKVLAETLHRKGINVSDIKAAVEAGFFDKSEKPPDSSDLAKENGATYSTESNSAICSTENNTDKEKTDE